MAALANRMACNGLVVNDSIVDLEVGIKNSCSGSGREGVVPHTQSRPQAKALTKVTG